MSRALLLIFGMAAVTYLPRALPAVLLNRLRFQPQVEKFFQLIPYTAMAALIFPGVLAVDAGRVEIGVVGGVAAGILAWRRVPVLVCVVAAIAVDFLLYQL